MMTHTQLYNISITNKKQTKNLQKLFISFISPFFLYSLFFLFCVSVVEARRRTRSKNEEEAWFQRDATVDLSLTPTRGRLRLKTKLPLLPPSAKRFCLFVYPFSP